MEFFDKNKVIDFMRSISPDVFDGCDLNMTILAEQAAYNYEMDYEGGPLDDPDHWIWDAALFVFEEFMKKDS